MTIAHLLWPALVAPFAGSLADVLAQRLARGAPVVLARSACGKCGSHLLVRDLVPLLSYAVLRGRCRFCGERTGSAGPLMELAAVGAAAWAASVYSCDALWASCVLGWMLLAISACDVRCLRLPDALVMPLIVLGLFATWWLDPLELLDHAVAAAFGYAITRGLGDIYRLIRGRCGIGLGDAKLLAASGAWLGLAAVPWVMTVAATTGILMIYVLNRRGQRPTRETLLPFGPFLALATWLVWLYG